MTRTEARQVARKLLKAGYHHPTICEDIESGQIYVTADNRCFVQRTVTSLGDLRDLIAE